MRRGLALLALAAGLAAAAAARADDEPKFAPIVIDEAQFNDIRNYLLGIDIPAKWTYPVLSRLDQLERAAQERRAAAEAAAEKPAVAPAAKETDR